MSAFDINDPALAINRLYGEAPFDAFDMDRVDVDVRMPHGLPSGSLRTYSVGDEDRLPKGDVVATLSIFGVRVTDNLDHLTLLVQAAGEYLTYLRQCADAYAADGRHDGVVTS